MIVAILGFSGNVGKTTIANNLFGPYLGVNPIHLESTNHIQSVSNSDKNLVLEKADMFIIETIYEKVAFEENLVLDVGASDLKALLEAFNKYEGILDGVDRFIIPVSSDAKQGIDSIKTAATLIANGVDVEKIFLVFNRLSQKDLFFERFKDLIFNITGFDIALLKQSWFIPESGLFDVCSALCHTVFGLAESEIDYDKVLKDTFKNTGVQGKRSTFSCCSATWSKVNFYAIQVFYAEMTESTLVLDVG
ncbi:hypothetical protein LIN78_16215 [Leeia sp. TBRC 13508]|uniref:Uncharacterized protein n=1 Tax=Leeia speluncae TaxID=2884804 RepID=A0ABS8DA54_9NEIS|nr:hypothetical protein [Leeia speluncae]MCB6185093.1 hypothetical protein [Leeia speluncae]